MSKTASLITRRIPLSQIVPHPQNPRNHPEEGSPRWEAMRRSLSYDYFDPLVWNERNGMLVSGHFRLKVLNSDSYDEVDVVVVNYDEPTHLARMIAANKAAGIDDDEMMRKLFADISGLSDIGGLSGFDDDEMSKWLSSMGEPDFDLGGGSAPSPDGPAAAGEDTGPPSNAIKYLQLIYSINEYEEFVQLLDKVRSKYRKELTEMYGDNETNSMSLNAVCLFLMRKLVADNV